MLVLEIASSPEVSLHIFFLMVWKLPWLSVTFGQCFMINSVLGTSGDEITSLIKTFWDILQLPILFTSLFVAATKLPFRFLCPNTYWLIFCIHAGILCSFSILMTWNYMFKLFLNTPFLGSLHPFLGLIVRRNIIIKEEEKPVKTFFLWPILSHWTSLVTTKKWNLQDFHHICKYVPMWEGLPQWLNGK